LKKKKIYPRQKPSYQALHAVVRTAGILQKAGNQFFRSYGLTQSQFNILMLLVHDFPEGCHQSSLSDHLLVNPADMTGLLKRMSKNGHVTRRVDPDDERAKIVMIAATGKNLFDQVEQRYYQEVENLMGFLTAKDSRGLVKMLQDMEEEVLSQNLVEK